MRKTKEEAQITKEKIIQASYEIIQEKGYEQMTRDDIAAKVGMTRGAVNWHFSSKEDIYLTRHVFTSPPWKNTAACWNRQDCARKW